MKIFVDDYRTPDMIYENHSEWVLFKTYQSFVDWYSIDKNAQAISALSLDHDLEDGHYAAYHAKIDPKTLEKTGYDIAKLIERDYHSVRIQQPIMMTSHSANPAGRKNIMMLIESLVKHNFPVIPYNIY